MGLRNLEHLEKLLVKFQECNRPVQSPINLQVGTINLGDERVKMDFKPDAAITEKPKIQNTHNGNQYQLNSTDHSELMVINSVGFEKTYHSREILIKVPSEHTLNGYRFDGEIQVGYVAPQVQCRIEGPNIAYLSIFLKADDSAPNDPFISTVLETNAGYLPETKVFDYLHNITNHVRSFESSYIQYKGTQTTPQGLFLNIPYRPCHDAEWIILSTPKLINTKQYTALMDKYRVSGKQTARKLQEVDQKLLLLQKGVIFIYLIHQSDLCLLQRQLRGKGWG